MAVAERKKKKRGDTASSFRRTLSQRLHRKKEKEKGFSLTETILRKGKGVNSYTTPGEKEKGKGGRTAGLHAFLVTSTNRELGKGEVPDCRFMSGRRERERGGEGGEFRPVHWHLEFSLHLIQSWEAAAAIGALPCRNAGKKRKKKRMGGPGMRPLGFSTYPHEGEKREGGGRRGLPTTNNLLKNALECEHSLKEKGEGKNRCFRLINRMLSSIPF